MGIYEEQIKERIAYDDEALSEAFGKMTGAILGSKMASRLESSGASAENAIGALLKFYNLKEVTIPSKLEDLDEKLEYVLQPNGIMRRRVHLDEEWYKVAYGPFLAMLKDSDGVVAIVPSETGGYKYYDETVGTYIKIDKKTAQKFDSEAYTFYKPFPMRKLKIKDLFVYIKELITFSDVACVLLLYLFATLLGLFSPVFTNLLYGRVTQIAYLPILLALGFFMIMVGISKILVTSIQTLVMSRVNTKVSTAVSAATMMRIFSLPVDFFRNYTAGELTSLTEYVTTLCETIISTILSTTLASLFSLLYITQIFQYAPSLVVPSVVIVLVTTVFSVVSAFANIKRSQEMMQLNTKTVGLGYSLINGVEKIKLAGAEKRAFAKWAVNYSKEAAIEYNPSALIKYSNVFALAITMIGAIVMYYVTVKSQVSLSEYAAFNVAYGYLSGAFAGLVGIVLQVANIKPILNMCKPILDAEPEASEQKEVLTDVKGDISIEHVSFRYNDSMPYVLDDLSLKIKKGQYVAIVGKTGCGKSTLVRLLLGFEKPERGAIYVDSKDIKSVDLKSLRRHIGTVMQNGKAFQGDVFSNITISAPRATLDDAWEAARLAGLDADIENMPMGMNTIITEGQGGISGGQRQRLLIARAVAPKPNLLIFDEATSALDNVTQKKVSDALDALKCTRIVIAHRLSTIKNCDRIVVLDQGHIIEDGTYDELISLNGYFKELVSRQQLDEE